MLKYWEFPPSNQSLKAMTMTIPLLECLLNVSAIVTGIMTHFRFKWLTYMNWTVWPLINLIHASRITDSLIKSRAQWFQTLVPCIRVFPVLTHHITNPGATTYIESNPVWTLADSDSPACWTDMFPVNPHLLYFCVFISVHLTLYLCEAFQFQCVFEWCFDFCSSLWFWLPCIALFAWRSTPACFRPWVVNWLGWVINDSHLHPSACTVWQQ